jgi:putative membrane-bound dehydrogenase-like protein
MVDRGVTTGAHIMRRWSCGANRTVLLAVVVTLVVMSGPRLISAADNAIPHAQDKPPNDPRDAQTAARLMTVPPGFVVDVVASEPDLVNPVAMAIDERGRFWITESLEYPRHEPGPGRDRVKIFEDRDGDGQAETVSVFLDGLNIPSGVQVGHGGVWIANAPDILFVPDADRDGRPDGPAEVVVTGFGRADTHELPNSLTWGPDGWLYGLNGVFNQSHVKYPAGHPRFEAAGGDQQPGWLFTCALFRIHPRTREFQVFCEGTSNPWGIAFNEEGDAFVSACVIDHLWHLVETGYYHRQGGPYPPHTWKAESIVKHKHQKAAYCGITWFDSDAYPEPYRKKLYMGNIHGGCINVDRLERAGSSYAGFGEPDFLTANDAWFMPVVQKTGPDGCLYVLDWYDRYHCYQDANRDPQGIDRLKGRLYRVRYVGDGKPTASPADVRATNRRASDWGSMSNEELIARLGDGNGYVRETVVRLLQERGDLATANRLMDLVLSDEIAPLLRRQAFFAVTPMVFERPQWSTDELRKLLGCDDRAVAAWMVRTLVEQAVPRSTRREGQWDSALQMAVEEVVISALVDPTPAVRLQALTFLARRVTPDVAGQVNIVFDEPLLEAFRLCGEDPLLQRIAWQTLKAYASRYRDVIPLLLADRVLQQSPLGQELTPRVVDWLLTQQGPQLATLSATVEKLVESNLPGPAGQVLEQLTTRVQTGELQAERLQQLQRQLTPVLNRIQTATPAHPLQLDAALLRLSWKDLAAIDQACALAVDAQQPPARRLTVLKAVAAAKHVRALPTALQVLDEWAQTSPELAADVISLLGTLDDAAVATSMLGRYPQLSAMLQPRVIELLTQRTVWAKALLNAVGDRQLPATVINVNQAQRLAAIKDAELQGLLQRHWGQVREGRSGDRDLVIGAVRSYVRRHPGDAVRGRAVFTKVCAQCHKLYGEGAEVGPEITLNGRNDYTQLLSNIFDPSLVIGAGYRSYTVQTAEGRVLNGLLVEDSPQRVVLKVQGGKQEVVARDDVEEFRASEMSLMPEALEKQLSMSELADLMAYLTLDRPPEDPQARRLPGVFEVQPKETTVPGEFAGVVAEVAPGFTKVSSGEGGVALLAEHAGRKGVLRTHPVRRDQPAVLKGEFAVPSQGHPRLEIDASHHPQGDWRLVVRVGQEGRLLDETVSGETCPNGWRTFTIDLQKFAGQTVALELRNEATGWSYEFGFWGRMELVTDQP